MEMSRQSEKHTMRMNHEDGMTHGMSVASNLSQCSVINLKERRQREVYTVQQTRTTLTTRKSH